jgi:hypothetical protein
VVFAAAIVGVLILLRGSWFEVPIKHFEYRTRGLLGLALFAAAPWLLAVWFIHGAAQVAEKDLCRSNATGGAPIAGVKRW